MRLGYKNQCQPWSLSGFSVTVPPNIAGESTPQDVSVLQNRQVTLECKSDAVPPPTLTWLKDGQPLQVRNQTNNCPQNAMNSPEMHLQITFYLCVGLCPCAYSVQWPLLTDQHG